VVKLQTEVVEATGAASRVIQPDHGRASGDAQQRRQVLVIPPIQNLTRGWAHTEALAGPFTRPENKMGPEGIKRKPERKRKNNASRRLKPRCALRCAPKVGGAVCETAKR
jgi:hypothetical protein